MLTGYEGIGFSLSASPGGASYGHPWKPFLGASSMQFALGLVKSTDVIVPQIDGVPMNGKDGGAVPKLKLDANKVNERGESFAVLEVVPDDAGKLTVASRVEIVHAKDGGRSTDPKLGRTAVAMILWQRGRPLMAVPILMFNVAYERVVPAPGNGVVRHLFI